MKVLWILILLSVVGCAKQSPSGQSIVGPPGPPGTPGLNAPDPMIVQFCQGTTHYPDTYCEVGFKYGSDIYGTYSANDGFSSYLPPGSYSSNGINCNCTFTINSNGSITN